MNDWISSINLYYLLCYAWDELEQRDLIDARSVGRHDRLGDLLARLLSASVADALRRGLDRAYTEVEEELAGIRGRVDFGASARRMLFPRVRAHCRFDEFVHDILQNRIIRSTLATLSRVEEMSSEHRQELLDLRRRMEGVAEIRVTSAAFSRVTIHRNNHHYRFILAICQLVHDWTLVDEESGRVRMADFSRATGMERLFERFLNRFYALEAPTYKVSAARFPWQGISGVASELTFLPEIRTDVLLQRHDRWIVMDAKFSRQTLQVDARFGKPTIRSGHLYQIYAYLQNLSRRPGAAGSIEGLLVYPRVDRDVSVDCTIHGYRVRAQTIDLREDWRTIHVRLLDLIT